MSTNSDSPLDPEHGRVQAMPALALIGGLAASLLGAVLWAVVTVAAKFQIGFMAVGMGVLVGFTFRYLGQGGTLSFGVLGAAVSLFGCLLGNLFSQVGFYAIESWQSLIDAWTYLDFMQIPSALVESFHPLDALFYVIALYEGYRFSVNKPKELIAKTTESKHLASSYPQNKKILAGVAIGRHLSAQQEVDSPLSLKGCAPMARIHKMGTGRWNMAVLAPRRHTAGCYQLEKGV